MKNLLKTLGKLGKGGATIAGTVLGVGGVSLGGDKLLSCLSELQAIGPDGLTAVGLALLIFGVGRKAGFVAGKEKP